jgi:hypothetical protein
MKQDVNSQALIRQIAAHVTCTVCGHHFALKDIEFVGRRENVWAMRVNCRECRTKALLFAVVNQGSARSIYSDLAPEDWERFKDSLPISVDDVISVHEYLQAYVGDFTDILEEPLPKEE